MNNNELADMMQNRSLVTVLHIPDVDNYPWLLWCGIGHSVPRRMYVCTGYHSFWANELYANLVAKSNFSGFYNCDKLLPVLKKLEKEYGVVQIGMPEPKWKMWFNKWRKYIMAINIKPSHKGLLTKKVGKKGLTEKALTKGIASAKKSGNVKLQGVRSGTTPSDEANAIATQSREILRTINTQLRVASYTKRDLPNDVVVFSETTEMKVE